MATPPTFLVLAVAGLFGYLFTRLGCEPAPLLLGFVLGRLLEDQFRLAMMISDGNPVVFFTRPLSGTLMVVATIVLASMTLPLC